MIERNNIQTGITTLVGRGWTLAAIADELDTHYTTLARWRDGERYPHNAKAVLALLNSLDAKKPPKKRRYGEQGHYMQRRARGE
jgi:hypothetical protein